MRLFVDNLTNVDFSYLHPERGLVGETWLASVELVGELDEQGMVCDFGIVKKMIRDWLDDEVDHRLLMPTNSKQLVLENKTSVCKAKWQFDAGQIDTTCPREALALVEADEILPSSVAKWCIEQLMPLFPTSVKQLKLTFEPEEIDGPAYHYSHGLKKHGGNCQRIAHGHRSKILIWRNGQLNQSDMKHWADKWKDIYIGTQEDLDDPLNQVNYEFRYTSQQGDFYLSIPKACSYLINTDSTVEFIAQHIAQELKKNSPDDNFRVKAFEGLGKGAIKDL